MLAQMLIEIARLDRWLTSKTPPHMEDQRYSVAWASIAPVVYAAAEAERAYVDFMMTGSGSSEPNIMDDTLGHLADTALMAIVAMQYITGNESNTGAVLLDRLRNMQRRMVDDQVRQRRYAKRQSQAATLAQGEWVSQMGNGDPTEPQ